jgi:hypothetical protein
MGPEGLSASIAGLFPGVCESDQRLPEGVHSICELPNPMRFARENDTPQIGLGKRSSGTFTCRPNKN